MPLHVEKEEAFTTQRRGDTRSHICLEVVSMGNLTCTYGLLTCTYDFLKMKLLFIYFRILIAPSYFVARGGKDVALISEKRYACNLI